MRLFLHHAACLLVVGLLGFASAGHAQVGPRERFAAGVEHFEANRFTEALDAFRDAYRMQPHPAVLVNIANCYMGLNRPLEAALYFEQYLREAGASIEDAGRREIERALAQARVAVATLQVTAPEGTAIFVDGDRHGEAPLVRPIEVNPGPHIVELRLPDGETQTRQVRVAAGQTEQIVMQASRASQPVEDIPEDDVIDVEPDDPLVELDPTEQVIPNLEEDRESGVPLGTWISGGAAVVAFALTLGFGIKALSQQDDYAEIVGLLQQTPRDHPAYAALQQDGRSVHDAQRSNALVADIMLVATLTGASLATFFYVRQRRRGRNDAPTVNAAATSEGGAVLLEGRF